MNTTIKTKLISGILLILVLLCSTLFFVLDRLSSLNERMTKIVDQASERIALSNELMFAAMEVGRNEKNMLLEKDISGKVSHEAEINRNVVTINEKTNKLEAIASEEGQKMIVKFRKAWHQYQLTLEDIMKLNKANENAKAFDLSMGKSKIARSNMIGFLNQIIDFNRKQMEKDKVASNENYNSSLRIIIILIIISFIVTALLSYWIIQTITSRINVISGNAKKIATRELTHLSFDEKINDELRPVSESLNDILESFREVTFNANEIAKGDYSVKIIPKSENDLLGNALNKMSESLANTTAANERHNWLTSGQNLLNDKLSGEKPLDQITQNVIQFLSEYTGANIGALYLLGDTNILKLSGRYSFSPSEVAKDTYSIGEGLPGQAIVNQNMIHLTNIKEDQLRVTSSILDIKPENIIVIPFFFDQKPLGAIELGKIKSFSETEIEFLKNSMDVIGININTAINRQRIQDLLEETQRQSEELQVQQEELKQMNEELEEQTQNLKQQQEELQVANEELEEQSSRVEEKNKELQLAQTELERKSREVEAASKYKSQFLANMSHELRTPLNSLLILSRDLSENKKKNLDETQIESARIIYKSGNDLLQLINEVLDLSKIEAGKMDLNTGELELKDLVNNVHRNFNHIAKEKGLDLIVQADPLLPETILTDAQRLDQIIKNLLSNAIKFTEKGSITVTLRKSSEKTLSIEVKDTGIGISEEKQKAVFEAFQQADGGTARKYGGTGLGLSISRELAKLLGGEIELKSKINEGSVFTLTIPFHVASSEKVRSFVPLDQKPPVSIITFQEKFTNYQAIPDDRESLDANSKTILIIEDDLKFASILQKQAQGKGFKVINASTGEDGLLLAQKFKPNAIILDLLLPGIDGKTVISNLKANPDLRHIPIHIISATERTIDTIKAGAVEYLVKPVNKEELEEAFLRIENFINRKMKNLLIVEDDENARKSIKVLIGNGDVKCYEAGTGEQALTIIKENTIDCIVLDLGLPDVSGFELIKKIQKHKKAQVPPIIVYTGKDLSREENDELQNFAETIIIKGVKSEERLLDETALFLHRTVSNLPEDKKDIIEELYNKEAIFQNKKVLIADDDMRNVFALTKVLKEYGMEIVKAENGLKAIEAVEQHPDISLVLMDVMMPEMDGLEAIRRIRGKAKYKDLPILTLTAKAMKEDRKKCIDAGANDYISKPIDLEQLLSLMRIWIKK